MKKNLTFFAGIVFLFAILIAGGCSTGKKQDNSAQQAKGPIGVEANGGHIYLKDSMVNNIMHLYMYDKHSDCGVLNDHLLVVKRKNTVKWKNAPDSEITEILHIRPVGDTTFWGEVPVVDTDDVLGTEFFRFNKGVFKLVIPDAATVDTIVKYEIVFTVGTDTTTHTIDPYLKIK